MLSTPKCLFQFHNTSLISEIHRNFSGILSLTQLSSAFYATSAALPVAALGTLSETAHQAPLNDPKMLYVTKEPYGCAR